MSNPDGTVTDDDLVDAYWTLYRLRTSSDRSERMRADEWHWAWERVHELIHVTGAAALPLLVRLCDAAGAYEGALAFAGADVIEALLMEYGETVVDAVSDAASKNPDFARALSHIDWPTSISEGGLDRLRRAADGHS